MASRKLLKKKMKSRVYDVLNECDYHIVHNTPSADSADKLIDEAVDFHDAMVKKLADAKTKKEFREIAEELEKMNKTLTDKLNALGS